MRGTRFVATAVVAGLLASAPAVGARTFEVTKRGDAPENGCTNQDCSLREAVQAANARPGADRIVLPDAKDYNLTQTSTGEDGAGDGDLDITNDPLTIMHAGRGRAMVDANGIDRVFQVFTGAPASFKKLTITGGAEPSSGDGEGGGIRTDEDVRVIDSTIVGNTAEGDNGAGGGILAAGGKLTILHSLIRRNTGEDESGAIEYGGDEGVVIRHSRLVGNKTDGYAAVGYWYGDGASRIVNSTMANNRAVGETGTVYYSSDGTLLVSGTTISGNRAGDDGGGFTARNGEVKFVNSTITGNRSTADGGGLWALTPVELNAVTIARNEADSDGVGGGTGGGLYKAGEDEAFRVENSLVALNKVNGAANDCASDNDDPFESQGHNLLSESASCFGFASTGDDVAAPKIGKLKNNGGQTKTIALKKRSPAINGAKKATAPKRDQRGKKRRRPDIGAYELVKKRR